MEKLLSNLSWASRGKLIFCLFFLVLARKEISVTGKNVKYTWKWIKHIFIGTYYAF